MTICNNCRSKQYRIVSLYNRVVPPTRYERFIAWFSGNVWTYKKNKCDLCNSKIGHWKEYSKYKSTFKIPDDRVGKQ